MTWFSDSNVAAESIKEHVLVVYAADLEFPSGNVRVCTYTDSITIDGDTFDSGYSDSGVLLVSVQEPVERVQLYAERWTYQLAGVHPSVIPESEIDDSYGGRVIEYEVWIDPVTRTVVGYEIRREGLISKMRRRDGAEMLIEVDVEHRLVILEDSDEWRYTGQHQRQFFAGDEGCDLVAELDSVEVIWGGKRVQAGGWFGNLMGSLNLRAQAND
jgi:hypothetical protein